MTQTATEPTKRRRARKDSNCAHGSYNVVEHEFCPNCGKAPSVSEQIRCVLSSIPKNTETHNPPMGWAHVVRELEVIAKRAEPKPRAKRTESTGGGSAS